MLAVIFAALKKLIAILLLVIVGLTAFTQCCTYDNCAQERAMTASDHSDDGGEDGACSPFSSCTTCFGFTIDVYSVQLPALASNPPQHRSLEKTPLLPSIAFAFWQPPWTVA